MDTTAKLTFLEQLPLFDVLTSDEKRQLASMIEIRKKSKHAYFYQAGDHSDSIYFLSKGVIKIGTHSNDGKEVIKAILHPLAIFGELCLVGERERPDFAKAMGTEVTCFVIRASQFRRLMQSNYQLSTRILHRLGERLRRTERRLEALVFKDARTRIIDFIKESASKRGMRIGIDETLVKHTLTQQDIANITGTSRQTVTSVLNELKKLNLIHFNRRSILIRDLAGLT
ncbi:MAG: Crp/Fnr family transcriptional regulator [Bacteroidota bacterium]